MNLSNVAEMNLSDLFLRLHCPACGCSEVRRSHWKNLLEYLVSMVFFLRTFRCEKCFHRFYDHVFRRRADSAEGFIEHKTVLPSVPVVVYGCAQTGEIFHEDTDLRMASVAGAMLNLTMQVEPGHELILMYPDSEQEQRCCVTSVTSTSAGTFLAHVKFADPTETFWRMPRPVSWPKAS
jgi:hypothetical protein